LSAAQQPQKFESRNGILFADPGDRVFLLRFLGGVCWRRGCKTVFPDNDIPYCNTLARDNNASRYKTSACSPSIGTPGNKEKLAVCTASAQCRIGQSMAENEKITPVVCVPRSSERWT
jgi:hypothetical protein